MNAEWLVLDLKEILEYVDVEVAAGRTRNARKAVRAALRMARRLDVTCLVAEVAQPEVGQSVMVH